MRMIKRTMLGVLVAVALTVGGGFATAPTAQADGCNEKCFENACTGYDGGRHCHTTSQGNCWSAPSSCP